MDEIYVDSTCLDCGKVSEDYRLQQVCPDCEELAAQSDLVLEEC